MSRYGGPSWPPPEPPAPRGLDLRRRYPSIRPSVVHGEDAGRVRLVDRRDVRQVEAPSDAPEPGTRDNRGTALRQHNEEIRERRPVETIDEKRFLADCELVCRGGDYQDAELLEDTTAYPKSRSPVSERNRLAANLQTSQPRFEAMQRSGSSPAHMMATLESRPREVPAGESMGSGRSTDRGRDPLLVMDAGRSRSDRDASTSPTSPSAVPRDTKETDTKRCLRSMPRTSDKFADSQDDFEYARRVLPLSYRAREPARKLENTRTEPPKTGRLQLQPRPNADLQRGATSSSSGGSRRTSYRTESTGSVGAEGARRGQMQPASATQTRFPIAPQPTATRLSISSAKRVGSPQADPSTIASSGVQPPTDQAENGSESLAGMEKDMTCPM